jgi:hypothetical protein
VKGSGQSRKQELFLVHVYRSRFVWWQSSTTGPIGEVRVCRGGGGSVGGQVRDIARWVHWAEGVA